MQTLHASKTFKDLDQIIVVDTSEGHVRIETWHKGYKEYSEITGIHKITEYTIRSLLDDLDIVGFDTTEICNFVHYSGCFYGD